MVSEYTVFLKKWKKNFFEKIFFSKKFFFDKIFFCKFKKNLKNIRPKKFWHHFLVSLTTKLNGPKFSYSKTRLIHRRRRLLRWSIFQRRLNNQRFLTVWVCSGCSNFLSRKRLLLYFFIFRGGEVKNLELEELRWKKSTGLEAW